MTYASTLFRPEACFNQDDDNLAEFAEDINQKTEHAQRKKQRAKPLIFRGSVSEHIPQKPRKKSREPKKRQLAPINREELASDLEQLGHQYTKASALVALCNSCSATSVAVYVYMDALMFGGSRDPKGYYNRQPEHTRVFSLSEIGERFGLSDERVSQALGELRQHGFVYVTQRGPNKPHAYTLVPRKMRIEHELAQDEIRKAAH